MQGLRSLFTVVDGQVTTLGPVVARANSAASRMATVNSKAESSSA